jgi:putative zinc finger protein
MKDSSMPNETNHLSDQEILLAADDELSSRMRDRVRAHLASCAACRVRLQEIESTLAEIPCLRRSDSGQQLPRSDAARALLKARLAEFSAARRPGRWTQISSLMTSGSRWLFVGAALCFAMLGIWAIRREVRSPDAVSTLLESQPGPVPDKQLTPGATLPVTTAEICRAADSGESHPIPVSMRRKVFQEYRTPESRASEYEVDFLITPGLGGADDIRNLWPEPYSSTAWNAHVKDALEDRLHNMVCSGQLDLATAQRDIATDWISAYKKYFHTQSPLSSRSSFVPDHL